MEFKPQVIIVGGGPTGFFLALRLSLLGIRVTVLEKDPILEPAVRALGYFGPTHFSLRRAGIFEEVVEKGVFHQEFSWRKMTKDVGPNEKGWGDLIAAWNPWEDSPLKQGDCGYGMVVLGQDKLREIILSRLHASELVEVLLGHEVVDISQDDNSATVTAIDAKGTRKQFTAAFVVGADGGKSQVRKLLGQPLNGFTWPEIIIATDVVVNFSPPKNQAPVIYLVDPDDWAFFCPLDKTTHEGPNLYRCTLPMLPEECEPGVFDECLKKKFERIFPGPRPLKYELRRCQQTRSHQRQVPRYVVGRGLLMGDAAHLNTSWGGLGLTTGLLDADSLADALDFVINHGRPLSVLQKWADARHTAFKDVVDPVSTANKKRCHDTDPEAPTSDPFLKLLVEKNVEELSATNKLFDTMATSMCDLVR